MCGIVGYCGYRDCSDVLVEALTKLEYRGYDSAGIAVFEDGNIRVEKSQGRLDNLRNKMLSDGKPEGTTGIGHTRWATHGKPSDVNSHPHSGEKVAIVHNGIIENYKELKDLLIEKGQKFLSDTDTEVVAKLLGFYYKKSPMNPLETIKNTVARLEGSYALGIVFEDFPDMIYAARKESPLIVGVGKDEFFIASDVTAIINYTKDYTVYRWNRWLYLEIYGCQTIECLDAEKIVLHNDDYSYSVLLKKGDFTISKLDKSKMPSAQGEVYVMHYFNLKIDVEGIRINWNVQMAQSEYTEWVPYHFDPLWG